MSDDEFTYEDMAAEKRGPLSRLERWFAAHCDGDWEHGYGVQIQTTDNPGWLVKIGIDGTKAQDQLGIRFGLRGVLFQEKSPELTIEAMSDELWGYCEPPRLNEMLTRMADFLEPYLPASTP